MASAEDLQSALRRYWGYETFRPLQERIVHSLLAGHDTAVVMPTGGGKSLCYQLPALVSGRTAIVISPLIALMQDQVAQLSEMGIPSAFLNSSLSSADQNQIILRAVRGEFRLLYLSPERLARADTITWLQRVPVAFFAIDEAHCISEWGHEFRPEYRQLSSLRTHFPEHPIAAFTASATQRVRHDILSQLKLRDPHKYIVSFHRPNLRYLVKLCEKSEQQGRYLFSTLQAHQGENVIVYSPTVAQVEATVDLLAAKGVRSVPYHGQMDNGTRKRNQERWMSDETRVLVGTLAFGLGINKPGVRAVIHLALPKSIEQYYQEAGRAGRDGQPADCVLLWQKRDAGLLVHFIEQVAARDEQQRAWQRYHEIRGFAERPACRHLQICRHFGETPKWETCDQCDICGALPEWLGLKLAHLSVPKLKPEAVQPVEVKTNALPLDQELMEYLREWRRLRSIQENLPAFMILQDSALEDLCRQQPTRMEQLRGVFGFGQKKTERYGEAVLKALRGYKEGARATKQQESAESPSAETIRLLAEGRTLEEIAQIRQRRLATVIDMVAELVERGRIPFNADWITPEKRELIEAAAARVGTEKMKTVKDALPEEITYGEIRLTLAGRKAREGLEKKEGDTGATAGDGEVRRSGPPKLGAEITST